MHAWSAEACPPMAGRDAGRVTGPSALRVTGNAGRAPAVAGLHVVVAAETVDAARTYRMTGDLAATPTDAELMARVVAGDEQAFAALYDRHVHAVYGAVLRYLGDPGAAEDVVQETYLAMWTRSDSYAAETGSLVGWLLAIARHRAIDRLRSLARRPLVVALAPATSEGTESDEERLLALGRPIAVAAMADDPPDLAERRWLRAVIQAAVEEMSAPEREVLELAYDEGLTQAEIAQRLGWPLGTVKTRTRRGLLRLRAMLERVPDIAPVVARPPVPRTDRAPDGGRHGPR